MNVLVTGGMGIIGKALIHELSSRNHFVTILDLKNRKNKKIARTFKKFIDRIIYGDIKNKEILLNAIENCDCIIHLAAVVPPKCEENKDLCINVNIEGTQNIIYAIKEKKSTIPIVYISSACVMGPANLLKPPVNTKQIPNPITNYAKSKLQAEKLLENSGLKYCILRLSSVLDTKSDYSDDFLKVLFECPLDANNEIILDMDSATAIVNASELLTFNDDMNRKVFFIGGGKENGCQITNRTLVESMLTAMGIGMISEECFIKDNSFYSMNWYDTVESEKLLHYQYHTFADYIDILNKKTLTGGFVVKQLAPKLKNAIEMQSPYFKKNSKES